MFVLMATHYKDGDANPVGCYLTEEMAALAKVNLQLNYPRKANWPYGYSLEVVEVPFNKVLVNNPKGSFRPKRVK